MKYENLKGKIWFNNKFVESKKAKLHSIVDINENSRLHAKKFKVPFYQNKEG